MVQVRFIQHDGSESVVEGNEGDSVMETARNNMVPGIIGDCGGFFKTGQVVDLGGTSYHNLLLTIVHAMGYADVTSVGAKGTTVLTPLLA